MEFGKHIGKGMWAFADKSLPAMYGVGFIFLVVRVLPEKEFGSFVLIQTVFTMATAFCTALALQPLTKFAAETKENGPYIVASLVFSALFYVLVSAAMFLFQPFIVPLLDKSGEANLGALIGYLPLLFLTSLYRTFAISLLQATYSVQRIFWIDAVYFLGALLLMVVAQQMRIFSTASDVIIINIIAQAGSTLLAIPLTRGSMSVRLSVHKEAFGKMWDFGKYSFGASATYMVYSQMDVFFVSSIAGIVALAAYNAAKTFTRVFDIVSQVIQMFIIPVVSKYIALEKKDEIKIILEKAISFSSLILVPLFLLLMIFPEPIMHILFKGKYDEGADALRIFSFLALIVPWLTVPGAAIVGLGKAKIGFYLGLFLIGISVVFYWLFVNGYGIAGGAIALITTNLLGAIVLVYYVIRYFNVDVLNVFTRVQDAWMFIREYISSYKIPK
ncbi:MAG: hypothetical protein EPO24_16530 [Bacteroidetes bacterium]|nr:MAG: hypothetical protein EPO24_16530 [Bacteroidota bacterium]